MERVQTLSIVGEDVTERSVAARPRHRRANGAKSRNVDGLDAPYGAYGQLAQVIGVAYSFGIGPFDAATGSIPDGITVQVEAVVDNLERTLLMLAWSTGGDQGDCLYRGLRCELHGWAPPQPDNLETKPEEMR